jgi:hypothetical protein
MATIAELEAYMDKIEERYFALYPEESPIGQRAQWSGVRNYIRRVKSGEIPGITLEMETPHATQAFVGFRRIMGEEPHPRRAIHKRQQKTRAAVAEREAAQAVGAEAAISGASS